jgi:hypothetical protein
MEAEKAEVFVIMKMAGDTKENGKTIKRMEKELIFGLTVTNILDIS